MDTTDLVNAVSENDKADAMKKEHEDLIKAIDRLGDKIVAALIKNPEK